MATYIGFYTPNPDWVRVTTEKMRRGELQPGQPVEPMASKVRELPTVLPAGCTLIGSYGPVGQSPDVPEARRLPWHARSTSTGMATAACRKQARVRL